MGKNKDLGLEGEQLAANYLREKSWHILEMNYRFSRSEVDLVASKDDLLIFVEVKTRTGTSFGQPEEFVDTKKAENIIKAADHYIWEKDWKGKIRFDIISIIKINDIEIRHFEDAFY